MIFSSGFADNLKEMQRVAKKISVFLFFGLLAFPISTFCQVDTAWVRHYNGTGDKTDFMLSSAIDDSGNSIVTGVSGYNWSTWDLVTIKYDRNGNQLWRQNYTGVQPVQGASRCLTLEKNGSIFVTGGRGASCFTLKYDSNGNRLWEALYSSTAAFGRGVTTDEKGNVYVTGTSGFYPNYDYLTIKYDSNGNQQWASIFNKGQNYNEQSYLLVPDKNGNVYVSGYSENGTSQAGEAEWITIKYDSLGNRLWMKPFSTWQGANWGAPGDMKLDALGNVYLAGGCQDSGTTLSYATIKYDPDGNQLWVARYRGRPDAYDFARALVLDSNANAYVTGSSYGDGTTVMDIATIKYDSSGNQLWIQRYNGPSNGNDEGSSIAVDSAENVYLAGESRGIDSALNYVILKYDSSGNFLWEKRHEGSVDFVGSEIFSIDRNGNLHLSGTDTQNAYDFVTIKYSPLPTLKGDLNLDGILTMADVVLMLNFTFNGTPFPAAPSAGDLNCDGKISPTDVVIMLQIFFLAVSPPC